MKAIAFTFPVLAAAALAMSGCAKPVESANVTVLNNTDASGTSAADGNLTDSPPADLNATDANFSDAPSNTR